MKKTFKTPIKIKVLAVGGAGCNFLERLASLDSKGIERIAVSIPGKVINRLKDINKIILNSKSAAQKDDVDFGKELAAGSRSKIIDAIKGADIVFVLGSLSKNFNIGIMEETISAIKSEGILSFVIATKPFSFEGKERIKTAKTAHKRLTEVADAIITIDSDKLLNQGLSAKEGLSVADTTVAGYIDALVDVLDEYGEINADFNDFKTTVANCGQAFIGIGLADRSKIEQAIGEATVNPYLENEFAGAERALYTITANPDLTMEEVKKIGDAIKAKAADNARIIFSMVSNKEMDNKVKIVILAGGVATKELPTIELFFKKQRVLKTTNSRK